MLEKLLIKQIYLPIIYIIIGYIAYKVITKVFLVGINHKQSMLEPSSYNYKKMETFKVLIRNIIRAVAFILVGLSILPVFGIDITSVLAGLGIVSAVLALSLQDILKDFFGGLTIIFENQFALGDTIEINGFKGEVIQIGLKSTRIRNYEGQVKILANRNITEVINFSDSYSMAVVDVSVSYEDNLEHVEEVLNDLAKELSDKIKELKGPIEVLGVQDLASSSVVYRLAGKTVSMEQYGVQRQIKREIKLKFDEENIKIPYNQIEVHNNGK